MSASTGAPSGPSWLDTRISRRRLVAFSGLIGIGAFLGYRLLGGFGGFRINTVEPKNPAFDPASYRLVVDGMVDSPISLTYDQLLALPSVRQVSDFHCVEGWGVKDVRWEGVRLQTILDAVHPKPEAAFITFHSLDGFYADSLSLGQASLPDALVAYRMYEQPLPPEHGYPLRFIMPKMYGYKGAKYLYRMEFVSTQVVGYWEQRGWQMNAWLA
ncbi:MAG TPA: molybdopterin-dependent oxidoreductase [Dehalococcoidia bacterium]|nr:molybdopterin-dependent oxidoreductase [Dehalococcoidia bacterium]